MPDREPKVGETWYSDNEHRFYRIVERQNKLIGAAPIVEGNVCAGGRDDWFLRDFLSGFEYVRGPEEASAADE